MIYINLRGTNGSGKTYLVRHWMLEHKAVPYPRANNLFGSTTLQGSVEYYRLNDGGIVVGNYVRNCGGLDGVVLTQQQLRQRLLGYAKLSAVKYVLFEGVIVSTIFESWLDFSKLVGGMIWVYLDTPADLCLKRVRERNNNAAINDQLIADKHHNIESTRLKAIAAGERVLTFHHNKADEELTQLIKSLNL